MRSRKFLSFIFLNFSAYYMTWVCSRSNACSDWLILGHYSPAMPTGRLRACKSQAKSHIINNLLTSNVRSLRNISNTSDSVLSGYPNTEKRVENATQRSIFNEIRGVWIVDETLSRVFDISSQSKQKLRRKSRGKIVKIYAN